MLEMARSVKRSKTRAVHSRARFVPEVGGTWTRRQGNRGLVDCVATPSCLGWEYRYMEGGNRDDEWGNRSGGIIIFSIELPFHYRIKLSLNVKIVHI